jgi:undecaprenyl-diphosphatase
MSSERPRTVLLLALAVLVALTLGAALRATLAFDVAVRDAVLAPATPGVVAVLHAVNHAGEWRVLLPATAVLFALFAAARRRWWVWAALMVAAPLAETALKHLVARPRPEETSLGFPSGHATAATAFFGAVLYLAGELRSPALRALTRGLAVAAIVLVALARIVLRAHWPTDVLGGAALGLALASAAALIARSRA